MKSFKTGAWKERIYTHWGPRRAAMNSFRTVTCRKWKKIRLLTGIVKRNLPAAVRESGPGAVVDGSSLNDARLGGVRLGSPHQHTDPGGETEVQERVKSAAHSYISISLLFHYSALPPLCLVQLWWSLIYLHWNVTFFLTSHHLDSILFHWVYSRELKAALTTCTELLQDP